MSGLSKSSFLLKLEVGFCGSFTGCITYRITAHRFLFMGIVIHDMTFLEPTDIEAGFGRSSALWGFVAGVCSTAAFWTSCTCSGFAEGAYVLCMHVELQVSYTKHTQIALLYIIRSLTISSTSEWCHPCSVSKRTTVSASSMTSFDRFARAPASLVLPHN